MSALILFATALTVGDPQDSPKVVELPGFTLVGIAVRTNNAREMSGDGAIGKQWQRLYSEHLLDKIPYRADSNVIALYTDYSSDATGDYTFLLGAKVSNADHVPAGMVVKKISPAKYTVFTSTKGPAGEVVPQLWKRIWNLPKSTPGGDRAYGADFELYDQRAANPDNAQVDIFISIR